MNISNEPISQKKRFWWVAGLLVSLSAIVFVIVGLRGLSFGFPLDDAWIHQTYARNLAQSGTWSFVPGEVSGGSTSPLWTVLLSVGYLVSQSFAWYWTLAISIASLGLFVVFLGKSLLAIDPGARRFAIPFGILLGLEWHLNWAAASGMETMLNCLGVALLVYLLTSAKQKWGWVGVVLGLLLWIRPDGITLVGPVGLIALTSLLRKRVSLRQLIPSALTLVIFASAYLVFNKVTTGNIFPNTFYAKQMEYQELWTTPFFMRALDEFQVIVVGPGVLVLPGFLYGIFWSIKTKNWQVMAFIAWVIGFGLIYAWRLPVTYQHGRYMIPVLPVYLLIGVWGSNGLLNQIRRDSTGKVAQFAFSALLVFLSIGFYFLGVSTYRQDVETINTLMVEPAITIREITQPSDVVAVHDIGAMGYFSGRKIVDLAGLINPEVIPFIRDESQLFSYMQNRGVNYFVCLDDWYKTANTWGEKIAHFSMKVDKTVKTTVILKLK